MPSNHLILCRPLLLPPSIFPSIRVFSNESALCIRWPKYWNFNFSISPSHDHPGLISFRKFSAGKHLVVSIDVFLLSQPAGATHSEWEEPRDTAVLSILQYAGSPSHQRIVQARASMVLLLRSPGINPEPHSEVERLYQRVLLLQASLVPKLQTPCPEVHAASVA